MILKGSQRGGALKLAAHLLRGDENDHVTVHELRGFSADDLREALREAEAVAKGTRCRQHLFSLSLNPPETEHVTVDQFEDAVAKVETSLGLQGRARAVVFHEKEGRRHAHVVWSRINVETMTAINLPFFKNKLKETAKTLFLEHGWRLPEGFRDRTNRNPLNFTLAEWQQAKRTKQNPERLKVMFRECWSVSDNGSAFAQALADQGFVLARGDRRGFVAVDCHGEVYSLSRWTGEKTKALTSKLGDPDTLPGATEARERIAGQMSEKLKGFIRDAEAEIAAKARDVMQRKAELKARQQRIRKELQEAQAARAQREAFARAARFRKGVVGLWDMISGKTRKVRRQNEAEAAECERRDGAEREAMIAGQLAERRSLQIDLRGLQRDAERDMDGLRRDIADYMGLRDRDRIDPTADHRQPRARKVDHDLQR